MKYHGLGFNDCNTSSCASFGPPVRFPFQIRGKQPNHCGYSQPGFYLSCSEKNETVLELPNSWKLLVHEIDYKSQVLYAKDSGGCVPRRLILNLNLSVSPFELMNRRRDITLFKCPSRKLWFDYTWQIPCLSGLHHNVLAILSVHCCLDIPELLNCTKIHDYSEVPYSSFDGVEYQETILRLNWSNPTCKSCDAKGKHCRSKMNTIDSEKECYGSIKPKRHVPLLKALLNIFHLKANCLLCYLFFIILLVDHGLGFSECNTSRCGSFGPPVRFPFRIRGKQPLHCGYPQPGFHLSCSENNETVLELPNSWKLFVQEIDYKSQVIHANDSGGCLPRRLILNLNLSVSPFEIMNRKENITLFKCPSRKMKDLFNNIWQIPCLSDLHYDVLAILSDWSIVDPDIVYCTKIHDYSEVASIDSVVYQEYILLLNWYNPTCKFCEAKGKYCRLKMNTIDSETECYGSIKPTKGTSVVLCSFYIIPICLECFYKWIYLSLAR
ncbi:hypothetical protein GH714_008232 [Hevea brasiliensis]|uniref:RING-type E3 ubiquitin transferase n=1 Tax=Hevea brasiliensis TaxID=3981 RepID=A0A6A6NCS0_HEVBR|nr:hypothetical protein GH714_008232 [Hevea brasiliensis]